MEFFWTDSGLLDDRVCLDESFPAGPCSTSTDENSLSYDVRGRQPSPPRQRLVMPETHIQKRLKRPSVRIGETLKRLRSTRVGRWWLLWVSSARQWVLGSSKATDAACLAAIDLSTDSALSRLLESVKKFHMGLYDPLPLDFKRRSASEGAP